MAGHQKTSKPLNITLWVVQSVTSATLIWSGLIKLFQPVEQLSAMWPWTAQIPAAILKLTGVVDLTGAIGLILPAALRIKPVLTPVAALAIIVLMICACIFHITREEASVIGVNIFFAVAAAFIAWGRFKKMVITPN